MDPLKQGWQWEVEKILGISDVFTDAALAQKARELAQWNMPEDREMGSVTPRLGDFIQAALSQIEDTSRADGESLQECLVRLDAWDLLNKCLEINADSLPAEPGLGRKKGPGGKDGPR